MTYAITISADDRLTAHRRPARTIPAQTLCGAAALTISVAVGAWGLISSRAAIDMTDGAPVLAQAANAASIPAVDGAMPRPTPARPSLGALLDPLLVPAGARRVFTADTAPLPSAFTPPAPNDTAPTVVAAAPDTAPPPAAVAVVTAANTAAAAPADTEADVPMPPVPAVVRVAGGVPLPIPRPARMGPVAAADEAAPARAPTRRLAARGRPGTEVAATTPADNRTFFEKLFGVQPRQPAGPALAYAAPEDGVMGALRGMASRPIGGYDSQTAVYDITAHTVYLPDGTRLEAHSGLGPMLDDPRHVSQRMRGPTPPHLYELTPREALFHGVRALRLNPVGGGGVFGRDGLLAHTFMLGPNGDSNGCVSFRNYDAFLQAFQRGQVKRLAVVTHLS